MESMATKSVRVDGVDDNEVGETDGVDGASMRSA